MRTCSAKRVFEAIVRLEGMDPDTANLTAGQRALRAELVNDRIAIGWEYAFWQETMAVEARWYREIYAADANYITDDEVFYEDVDGNQAYYKSLQDGNVGQTPVYAADTAWWHRILAEDDFLRYVAFDQPDETVIHRVDCAAAVFDRDPRVYRDAGRMRDVRLLDDRVVVEDALAPVNPWVRFQKTPPEVSWTEWSAAVNYAIGDLRYSSTTGQSYVALLPSLNKNPTSETEYWEEVGFPQFLLPYVKHAVASDLMQEDDGKYKERSTAEAELERMSDVLMEAEGQQRQARFR